VAIWEKFNPRERLTAIGAALVILAWLVGVVARGFGLGSVGLVGGIAVLVILYLKYAPNQNITWPIPVPLLVLGIAGIVAVLAALDVLTSLRYLGLLGVGIGVLALILEAVGAGLMAWGAWQEYQIEKPAMPNFSSGTSSTPPPPPPPPAAPPTYPTSAPSAPAAPPTTPDDTEGAPPA